MCDKRLMKHIGEQAKLLKCSSVAMFATSDNRSVYAYFFLCSWGKQNKKGPSPVNCDKSVIFYLELCSILLVSTKVISLYIFFICMHDIMTCNPVFVSF